jgi:hypothetical protein
MEQVSLEKLIITQLVGREILDLLWNLKVHYRIHKTPHWTLETINSSPQNPTPWNILKADNPSAGQEILYRLRYPSLITFALRSLPLDSPPR